MGSVPSGSCPRGVRRTSGAALVASLLAVGSTSGAAAAPPEPKSRARAAALNEEAFKLCVPGTFDLALSKLEEARRLDPKPLRTWNLARCRDMAGRCLDAGAAYRELLSEEGADPEHLRKAEDAVRRLDETCPRDAGGTKHTSKPAGASAPTRSSPGLPRSASPPAETSRTPEKPIPEVLEETPRPPVREPPGPWRWVAAGGAVALGAAAVGLHVSAEDLRTSVRSLDEGCPEPCLIDAITEVEAKRREEDANRLDGFAFASGFGAGALAILSAVLFLSQPGGPVVSLSPIEPAGGVRLGATISF